MADEITVAGSLSYIDSENANEAIAPAAFVLSVATKKYTKFKQSIGTSEEAVQLGEITSPGYALFVNRDATNYIELRVGTAGAKFATLKPGGGFAILYLGAGAQAPFAIANTAACQMETLIISQ